MAVWRMARIASSGKGFRLHAGAPAEVVRPVMAWLHPGRGRADATTSLPGAPGAARSDSEPDETSRIAFASLVSYRASVAQVVRWSGKVFTRAHVPVFERTRNAYTQKPRGPAPRFPRVHHFLYAWLARHALCICLVQAVRCDEMVCRWLRPACHHPDTVGGWRGAATQGAETAKMDANEILTFVVFGVVVLCVLAWRRGY